MGKVKNWLMDMEEAVNDAVASGCSNLEMERRKFSNSFLSAL